MLRNTSKKYPTVALTVVTSGVHDILFIFHLYFSAFFKFPLKSISFLFKNSFDKKFNEKIKCPSVCHSNKYQYFFHITVLDRKNLSSFILKEKRNPFPLHLSILQCPEDLLRLNKILFLSFTLHSNKGKNRVTAVKLLV